MTLHKRTYKRGIAISVYLPYVFFILQASLKRKNVFGLLMQNKISVVSNYSKFLAEHGDALTNLYKCIYRGVSKVSKVTMTRRVQTHTHIRRSGFLDGGISFF
jgi:hypothetical protein